MKIPDHVLDLMLIGAIGAICLVPHGTKTASPLPETQQAGIAPECAMPVQEAVAAPVTTPSMPRPAQPIRATHEPCPGDCGMG